MQTVATPNAATYAQYAPVISEKQFSASAPSAGEILTSSLEPDGLIKISTIVTTAPTVTGGDFFVEYIDIHYLSNNSGTLNKAPSFYE